MLKHVLIVLLSIAIIMPGVCWSAEGDVDNEEIFTLDEIIVSATKTEETRKDISNSVIIVDEDDIEESAANSLGDLLGNEQGIDLRTYGNYGGAPEGIHIRGMGADGTRILVNGIAINSPSLGTADAGRIPLNNVKKIEVVKGSGSLLYGTGAMAGTINIITKRPERDFTDLRIGAGYGSNSTYEISAEHGMFLTEKIGYYVTASRKETDGFRSNSDLDHKDISVNLGYDVDQGLDVSFYGDYLDRSYGLPGVKTPAGTSDFIVNGVKLYDSESANLLNEGGDEDMHLALDISCSPINRLKLNLKGTYMNIESFNKSIYYFFVLSGSKTWVTNKVMGIEGNADIDLFEGMNLLVGAEYKRYDWGNKGIILDENTAEINGTETMAGEGLHTFGLFTEAQYRPIDKLKLIAGLRREYHSEFGNEYVQRYGMVINPQEGTAIKFNYGEHFNAPTPNALFWPYEDWGWGMGTQGNRNLRPETGRHLDAGIEQSFLDNKLFLNVSCFKWDIKDKINWVPDASFFYTPQNLDSYRSHGWEIGSDIGPFYNMTFSFAYTYTDAEEEISGGINRRALYASNNYLKSSLDYFNDAGFNANATLRYTGDRPAYYAMDSDIEPDVTLLSYYTVDLKVDQRFFEKWFFSLQCNNLLDKDYDTYTESFIDQASGAMTIGCYPGEGRSFLFRVSYKY